LFPLSPLPTGIWCQLWAQFGHIFRQFYNLIPNNVKGGVKGEYKLLTHNDEFLITGIIDIIWMIPAFCMNMLSLQILPFCKEKTRRAVNSPGPRMAENQGGLVDFWKVIRAVVAWITTPPSAFIIIAIQDTDLTNPIS